MILSFDISTSCIGWCLFYDDGEFSDVGYLELKKIKSLYQKLDKFRELLDMLNCRETPGGTKIYVEAPLQRSNNQNVVNLLQRWNGMCCVVIYDRFKEEPVLLDQRTSLKELGIKIPKGVKGKERKKYILRFVQDLDIIPEDRWAVKRTGNPCDWCYDQADAFIIALAGLGHE